MRTQEQVNEIVRLLLEEYPEASCTLDYGKDYELLFSVRLAAQCTDERVNQITPALFERFPSLESFAEADVREVEQYVHSCGFFRAKAQDIVACAQVLLEKHGGKVPGTMEELTALPGVGRKTANLILGDVYHAPGATVVDTHCIRLSNRMGLVDDLKDPVKIWLCGRSCPRSALRTSATVWFSTAGRCATPESPCVRAAACGICASIFPAEPLGFPLPGEAAEGPAGGEHRRTPPQSASPTAPPEGEPTRKENPPVSLAADSPL